MTRLLDAINTPADLRKLDRAQLPQVAQEIRETVIDVASLKVLKSIAVGSFPWGVAIARQ